MLCHDPVNLPPLSSFLFLNPKGISLFRYVDKSQGTIELGHGADTAWCRTNASAGPVTDAVVQAMDARAMTASSC